MSADSAGLPERQVVSDWSSAVEENEQIIYIENAEPKEIPDKDLKVNGKCNVSLDKEKEVLNSNNNLKETGKGKEEATMEYPMEGPSTRGKKLYSEALGGYSAIPQHLSDILTVSLNVGKRIKKYADYKPREPEAVSAADIDGYKYTDCLQYRVWKKMLKIINPVTVTLDPNTAHPQLTLSEDLTIVTLGSTWREDLPDNLERFDREPCVLGSEGFTSGRHSWVVDVEKQTDCWILGVTAESANRKGYIRLNLKPELGYWTVELFCEGGYFARTDKGWIRVKVLKSPKKVLVCMDYEAGKVSFSNADDMSHIYTFTHKFKHKIFPFFYPWTVGAPLRICNL
nr:PREDICTED: E3 ubiquitin-protein ligase TRIM39-like [Latimeria chalumnae]|eukprot:XP_014353937.1 PREDICTED: E3 ubiquitin-protein ligase TRIM39-like [Latimeria chalumnae]